MRENITKSNTVKYQKTKMRRRTRCLQIRRQAQKKGTKHIKHAKITKKKDKNTRRRERQNDQNHTNSRNTIKYFHGTKAPLLVRARQNKTGKVNLIGAKNGTERDRTGQNGNRIDRVDTIEIPQQLVHLRLTLPQRLHDSIPSMGRAQYPRENPPEGCSRRHHGGPGVLALLDPGRAKSLPRGKSSQMPGTGGHKLNETKSFRFDYSACNYEK